MTNSFHEWYVVWSNTMMIETAVQRAARLKDIKETMAKADITVREIQETAVALYHVKRKMEAAAKEYEDLEAKLTDMVSGDDGPNSFTVDVGDNTIHTTVVRGTRIVIDEAQLKGQLGAPAWNRLSKKVLDKAKLEAAIALGEIDPMTVALASQEIKNKVYFRFKSERKPVTRHRVPSPNAPSATDPVRMAVKRKIKRKRV